MRHVFVFFVLILIVCSCNSQTEDLVVVDSSINIEVADNEGNDLLDPANQDAYHQQEIKIYYLVDGDMEKPPSDDLGFSNDFKIYQHTKSGNYRIRVHVYYDKSEEYPITIIQWNKNDLDTLKFHFIYDENFVKWDKIWYNGNHIPVNLDEEKVIKIVK